MQNDRQIQGVKVTAKKRKKTNLETDFGILVLTYILVIIGLAMIYSSSSIQAQFDAAAKNDSMYFLTTQLKYVLLGTIGLFVTHHFIDYRLYKKFYRQIYLLNILLLFLTKFSPLGRSSNNAQRWIYMGIRFQTSEFSKLATVIVVAALITRYRRRMKDISSIIVPLGLSAVTFFLIYLQPSFSAGLIVMITTVAMLFIGGMSISHTLGLLVFGSLGAFIMAKSASYRVDRLESYLDPFKDMSGDGYQIANSILAIASGNISGVGYGKSIQKYFYIPEPQNDFIFAIIAEEFGLLGSLMLIALFLVLIYRIFSLFMSVEDIFAKMMVAGIGVLIGLQMFMNIAVASGLIPNTGVGLPFISYGGTSIIIFLTMIGILLNISKHRKAVKKVR